MIINPLLVPHFVWDACELSKFDGEEFVQFIHELWTANQLWEVQVCQYFLFQLWFTYSSAVQTARSGRETMWVHSLCQPDEVVLILRVLFIGLDLLWSGLCQRAVDA